MKRLSRIAPLQRESLVLVQFIKSNTHAKFRLGINNLPFSLELYKSTADPNTHSGIHGEGKQGSMKQPPTPMLLKCIEKCIPQQMRLPRRYLSRLNEAFCGVRLAKPSGGWCPFLYLLLYPRQSYPRATTDQGGQSPQF